MHALVLLNADAGTMGSPADRDILETAHERFAAHGWTAKVSLVSSAGMDHLLDAAANSSADVLIVGGGDGTISRAVTAIIGTGKAFGVLPMGTFNLLSRDLGMPSDLGEAIDSLCRAERRLVDLAILNGRPFHSLSGLGFFARVARERERARRTLPFPRWINVAIAATRAIFRSGPLRIEIEAGSETRSVEAIALLVTNNRLAPGDWHRERLDEGVLEIHVLGRCALLARLKAGLDVIRGRWRSNPTIQTFTARSIVVRSRRTRLWVATDGELTRETTPLSYGIKRGALTLLVPPPEQSGVRSQNQEHLGLRTRT